MVIDPNTWVDIDMAAVRLARIYDPDTGTRITDVRRAQWKRRIWVWIHRAKKAGATLPDTEKRGGKVYYRLIQFDIFAAKQLGEVAPVPGDVVRT